MTDDMTVLSREQFEYAVRITNIKEAVEALLNYKHFRTLGDVLISYTNEPQVKKVLVEGLLAWFPESKKDTVDKKVRNWLSGRTQSIHKKDAFILSRILGLTLEKTNEFLKMVTGEGIHWRDPEDIVWSYAIVHHLEPAATLNLLERACQMYKSLSGNVQAVSESYTENVYKKLQNVLYSSEEELLDFIAMEWENLGVFHNTAHQIFMQYMDLLEAGFAEGDVEELFPEMTEKEKKRKGAEVEGDTELYQPEPISSKEILETYLYRSLVPTRENNKAKKGDPFWAIRHNVRQNWPDEFTLSRMKNRQIDVTRKVLILLFLATDGSHSDYREKDYDEEYVEEEYTEDEVFFDIYTRLNLMLNSCGFLRLDPRNAFDWIILYCISSGDLWESDERIRGMLLEIFQEEN